MFWGKTYIHVIFLLILGAAIFLFDLGQENYIGSREARHAEIAREMAESGSFILPSLLGRPYTEKAPLFNWIVAILFRLIHRVDFFIARIPSALCGIAAMLGIYVLGRRWFSVRTGMFAAIIWATSWIVIEWGRFCRMDMMMTFLLFLGIILADYTATEKRRGRQMVIWSLACILISASVLSKGFYALLFPCAGVLALWRARRGSWFPDLLFFLMAIGIFICICAMWVIVTELANPGHMKELAGYQFGRALKEHPGWITLYFDQILLRTAPWGIFSAGAIYSFIHRLRRSGYDLTTVPPLIIAVCLIVLTIMPNRRAHYALPLLPMWALFLGEFLDHALALTQRETDRWSKESEKCPRWSLDWPLKFCLITIAIFMAICLFLWPAYAYGGSRFSQIFFFVEASLALSGAFLAWQKNVRRALIIFFLICTIGAIVGSPLVTRYLLKPAPEILLFRQIAKAIPEWATIAEYNITNEYFYFKMNRPVFFAQDIKDLKPFLERPGSIYLIVNHKNLKDVIEMTSRPLRKIGAWKSNGLTICVLATEGSLR